MKALLKAAALKKLKIVYANRIYEWKKRVNKARAGVAFLDADKPVNMKDPQAVKDARSVPVVSFMLDDGDRAITSRIFRMLDPFGAAQEQE